MMHIVFTMMEALVKTVCRLIISMVAATAGVSSASAADFGTMYPPIIDIPSAPFSWSGFYAGVYAGYGAGRATNTGVATGSVSPVDVEGALLGGTVGVNTQFDNFVVGAEGDLAWSGVKGSATCAGAPAYECHGALDWAGSAKLRGGIALDRVLVFGTAGLAVGGITASTNPAAPASSGSFSSTVWGWTLGGGAELAVTDAVSVKAEYAYYDFASVQAPINTIANLGASDIKSHAHMVKLGLNYRF